MRKPAALFSFLIMMLPAGLWLWSLGRFYRRFVFDEGAGRVWALSDDMYISACFGRSLWSGVGLVWYDGAPRVEGISNPLWTVLIGALHRLPGFSEDLLGLWVVLLNAALLVGLVGLFARSAWYASAGSAAISGGAVLLLPWSISLAYWSAEGFEVALMAVLALAALYIALLPRTLGRAIGLGLLLAAGIATRMDFVVLATAACLVAVLQPRGPHTLLVWTAATTLLIVGGLLLARRVYFGDWLPNTYYLKTTGWPLALRVRRGVQQNGALLVSATLAFAPLLLPRVRQSLGALLPYVVAGWTAFAAAVLYSTYVGGDAWNLVAGYDRHTAAASVMLAWSNCLLISAARGRWARGLCAFWALLLAAAPVFVQDGAGQIQRGVFAATSRLRENEREWIRYGKLFREVSLPGARIAVCPAGAIIYFSHRGGFDLLGKVDPFVAHLPVADKRTHRSACYRDAPGHNKGDDAEVYKLRAPEFSRGKLPASQRGNYFPIKYKANIFLARKDTTLLAPSFRPQPK